MTEILGKEHVDYASFLAGLNGKNTEIFLCKCGGEREINVKLIDPVLVMCSECKRVGCWIKDGELC